MSSTNTVEYNFALGTGGSLIAPATSNTIGSLFTTGGNIGIGTTAPSAKLDVAGSMLATNITVTNLTIGNLTVGLNSQFSGSFTASNNVAVAADVTGFLIPAGITSFESSLSVTLVSGTTSYESFTFSGVKTTSSWDLFVSQKGTSTGVHFDMNSSGQLQYTSTNVAGFVSSTFRYTVSQISGTGSFTPSNPVTSGNYLFDSIQVSNTTNAVVGTSLGGLSVLGGATIAKDIVVSGGSVLSGNSNTVGSIFTTGGNVGIGTTSPSALLTVNGGGSFSSGTISNLLSTNVTVGSILATNANLTNVTMSSFASGNASITGNVTVSGNLSAANFSGQSAGMFKNVLLNGDFQVNQRQISNTNIGTTYNYPADRWVVYRTALQTGANIMYTPGGNLTSSDLPFSEANITKFVRVGRISGNTGTQNIQMLQQIESYNCYPIRGKTVTLSYYYRVGSSLASLAGNALSAMITTGTGIDQNYRVNGFTGSTTGSQLLSMNTSWTKGSVTATLGSNINELVVAFVYTPSGTAGASEYFEVTGVQLEVGSNSSSFEWRPYALELRMCQRYFKRIAAFSSIELVGLGAGFYTSATVYRLGMQLTPEMRVMPNVTSNLDSTHKMIIPQPDNRYLYVTSNTPSSVFGNGQGVTIDFITQSATAYSTCIAYLDGAGGTVPYIDFNAEFNQNAY